MSDFHCWEPASIATHYGSQIDMDEQMAALLDFKIGWIKALLIVTNLIFYDEGTWVFSKEHWEENIQNKLSIKTRDKLEKSCYDIN